MKVTLAVLFTFLILLSPIVQCFILIEYSIHKSTISKELCVNRFVKNSDCNGKCQLTKRLKTIDSDTDFMMHKVSLSNENLLMIYQEDFNPIFVPIIFSKLTLISSCTNTWLSQYILTIPTPPPENFV